VVQVAVVVEVTGRSLLVVLQHQVKVVLVVVDLINLTTLVLVVVEVVEPTLAVTVVVLQAEQAVQVQAYIAFGVLQLTQDKM
jgi:hypothetical protein